MGKPKAPTPADPKVTAGAQTAQNIGTAIAQSNLNNVNQVTPDGSLTYAQTGTQKWTDPNSGQVYDIPQYTATQRLSESGQATHDQNQQTALNLATLGANQSGRLDGLLARPIELGGLPEPGNPGDIQSPNLAQIDKDFSEDRQRVENALLERLNPSLSRDKEALEARLASQGISLGSEAYEAAMGDYGRQSNDARLAAIIGAGQEQSRLSGLEAQRVGMNNQAVLQGFNAEMAKDGAQSNARNAALQETFAVRNQPINEITALMNGAQVQTPNFVNTSPAQIANTDFAGIQANYDNAMQQRYQSQMSGWNQIWGGLGGLGGAAIGAF